MATVVDELTQPPPAPPRVKSVTATVVTDEGPVTIPDWVSDLDAFRRWLDTDPIPEKARTYFFDGGVWVDTSKEQLFSHGDVKTEIAVVLRGLTKPAHLGRYWCNGILLTNPAADLSGNPDGVFVSSDGFASSRVRVVPGSRRGFVELEGTPDMVLEVVSDSSVTKDTATLLTAYHTAGIPEYWVVDARDALPEFTVYARGAGRYAAVEVDADGWRASAVFRKAFRLAAGADPNGNPEYTLEVR